MPTPRKKSTPKGKVVKEVKGPKEPKTPKAAKPPRFLKGGRAKISKLPKGPNGLTLCRYCKTQECQPPRRTFCSEICVHEHRLRTSGSYLRDCVYKRDKGVCKECGEDTKLTAKHLWGILLEYGMAAMKLEMQTLGIPVSRKVWRRKHGGGLWDADHILAVFEGGGSSSDNNIQTLCIPCHAMKTKQQRIQRQKAK